MIQHIHGEVQRLLEEFQGRGAVGAVAPAGEGEAHSFYAGTSVAPRTSLLEALLLALGGDLADGARRYEEIVVVNVGRNVDTNGLDKPLDERLRIPVPGGEHLMMGEDWEAWHYRLPAKAAEDDDSGAPAPATGGHDPLGGERPASRRDRWSRRRARVDRVAPGGGFPKLSGDLQIKDWRGLEYPRRVTKLREIVEELACREHRTLLLVEIGVLDYDDPQDVAAEHKQISPEGEKDLNWFSDWINDYALDGGPLDLVLYGRNRRRVDALFQGGLPGRPDGWDRRWPSVLYTGHNILRIAYPCGPFPWGQAFTHDRGFDRNAGTAGEEAKQRREYHRRTLTQLLRGEGAKGGLTRLKFAAPRPTPPPHPGCTDLISREFWAAVDVDMLETTLDREFFGATDNEAIVRLLATLRTMQAAAERITDPVAFHARVRDEWLEASSLLAWGIGGTGKSYLGKVLSELIFGHEAHLFTCERASGGDAFARSFFGSPPSYVGSDSPTSTTEHLVGTQGFTVLIIDEFNRIGAGDVAQSIKPLYGVLEEREFEPVNAKQIGVEPISLWNSLIVLTANLSEWPPREVGQQDVDAMARRINASEYTHLDREGVAAYAQWFLRRIAEETLEGVAVCHCDDLPREVRRLDLRARTVAQLKKELLPAAGRVRASLASADIHANNCPLFLDVTEHVRHGLAP